MTLSAIDAIDHWQEEATRWKAEATRMRNRIECLRGALKSAAGRAYEVAEFRLGDDCMEWAGDMEPPLMGSNVGGEPTPAEGGRSARP